MRREGSTWCAWWQCKAILRAEAGTLLGQRQGEGLAGLQESCSLQELTWGWVSQGVIILIPNQGGADQHLRFQPWRSGETQGTRALPRRPEEVEDILQDPRSFPLRGCSTLFLPSRLGTVLGRRHRRGAILKDQAAFSLMSDSFLIWVLMSLEWITLRQD